jgi:hypothetical protein
MPLPLDEVSTLLAIEPGNAAELDAWLGDVRRLVPLAQPTAYRLARQLLHATSHKIHLTEEVQAGMGRVPFEWEEDINDLYRGGLLAMWMSLRSPTVVVLLRSLPTQRKSADAVTG